MLKKIIWPLILTLVVAGLVWAILSPEAASQDSTAGGASGTTAQAANDEKIRVYFFRGDGCPHCAQEEPFLSMMTHKYSGVKVYDYEVYYHPDNGRLLQAIGAKLGTNVSGIPFTVVGAKHFSGYNQYTAEDIEDAIKYYQKHKYADPIATIVGLAPLDQKTEPAEPEQPTETATTTTAAQSIQVPFLGKINPAKFSLPALTVIFGLLDGFNPCAMWTLVFLISMLLGMNDKRRMWILGTAFIVASATVYFLFMTAWLKLILFLGFIVWVRVAIGAVAIGAGGFNLREYWTSKDGACKVTGTEERKKTFDKIRDIVHRRQFWLALGGIVVLAFAVNLVELVCSAGFPAIYTQVLALSHLATWQYLLYITAYIFFFMLDDMVVFIIAMLTMKMTGLSGKYSRYSNLIGGILMVILGLLLIFKPSWLMFG